METQNDEAKKTDAGNRPLEKGGVAGVDSKEGKLEEAPTNDLKKRKRCANRSQDELKNTDTSTRLFTCCPPAHVSSPCARPHHTREHVAPPHGLFSRNCPCHCALLSVSHRCIYKQYVLNKGVNSR